MKMVLNMLHLKINYSINQANFMTAGDHTHTHTHTQSSVRTQRLPEYSMKLQQYSVYTYRSKIDSLYAAGQSYQPYHHSPHKAEIYHILYPTSQLLI